MEKKSVTNLFNGGVVINGNVFEKKLAEQHIKISSFGKNTIRMVTHLNVSEQDIAYCVNILEKM